MAMKQMYDVEAVSSVSKILSHIRNRSHSPNMRNEDEKSKKSNSLNANIFGGSNISMREFQEPIGIISNKPTERTPPQKLEGA